MVGGVLQRQWGGYPMSRNRGYRLGTTPRPRRSGRGRAWVLATGARCAERVSAPGGSSDAVVFKSAPSAPTPSASEVEGDGSTASPTTSTRAGGGGTSGMLTTHSDRALGMPPHIIEQGRRAPQVAFDLRRELMPDSFPPVVLRRRRQGGTLAGPSRACPLRRETAGLGHREVRDVSPPADPGTFPAPAGAAGHRPLTWRRHGRRRPRQARNW